MNPIASRLIRAFAYHGGVVKLLSRLHRKPRILMLHGVGGQDLTASGLREQLGFLTKHFSVVPLEEICKVSNELRDQPRVALTFDDGLRNNLTVAYPILKEFNAPATFFVCPGLIDSGGWLWNHECRARLWSMPEDERRRFGATAGVESSDPYAIVQALKYKPSRERKTFEATLRSLTPGFQPTDAQCEQFDLMSWDEIRQLDPALITIGAHSMNHEILSRLEPADLEREVGDCAIRLREALGRPALYFCYPDGAYNDAVRDCVGRHFELAVTTEPGWVPENYSTLQLPRIPIAATAQDLAWRMQRPAG